MPRPSDAIPEGLVDVQRRSNCALDAIVAVLCRCPTFVRAAGRPSQGDSRALRALDASLQAAERGANSDAAVDALREALASSGDDTVIRAELKTRGAHLDVAEVLGEVVNVARPSAQQALRTRGRVSQQACRRCGHFNDDFVDDVELNELARSAPAAALVHAAETNGSLERVYLEAHAHAPKTCDKCRAPQACDVDVLLEQSARALVLSVGWPSSNVSSDDVLALLAFVGRSGARDCGRAGAIWPDRVFAAAGNNARPLDLLAVVVFQNAHYTAFVRSPDGADAWTHHDRQARIHVGAWTDVVRRCATATSPMLPYLLVYDELVAADPTAIFDSPGSDSQVYILGRAVVCVLFAGTSRARNCAVTASWTRRVFHVFATGAEDDEATERDWAAAQAARRATADREAERVGSRFWHPRRRRRRALARADAAGLAAPAATGGLGHDHLRGRRALAAR